MTKKNYIAIAEIIKECSDKDTLGHSIINKNFFIMKLSSYFKGDNPNFDRNKFENACY